MAGDRFVRFRKDAPTHDHVQRILENYFAGCGVITEDQPQHWMIVLPGKATSPFDGIPGGLRHPTFGNEERWLEVVLTGAKTNASLDVLTRAQDEFTNAIADGLARAFARFYRAKLDDG